jgi:ABC-type microcin C transport system permease subunit YejB
MVFVAWFSLIIYVVSMLLNNYKHVKNGMEFGQFTVNLLLQSCIVGCLVYLILLL